MKLALTPARWMQRLGLDRFDGQSGAEQACCRQRLQRMQSQLPTLKAPLPELPAFLPAQGPSPCTSGLVHRLCGRRDVSPRPLGDGTRPAGQWLRHCDSAGSQGCCGAIHYHSGASEPALGLMKQNMAAFDDPSLDAIIVNVAGCGAMLKDYSSYRRGADIIKAGSPEHSVVHMIDEFGGGSKFSHRSERHQRVPDGARPSIEPEGSCWRPFVAYQDACHLQHAQTDPPVSRRDLLKLIPGNHSCERSRSRSSAAALRAAIT
jgi:glycolate oxidase iron-sulfur subunit